MYVTDRAIVIYVNCKYVAHNAKKYLIKCLLTNLSI